MQRSQMFRADLTAPTLIVIMAAVIGMLAVWSPLAASLAALGVLVLTLAGRLRPLLPRFALTFLGICLAGYALLGRGFAYLGAPPLYVGELALCACVLAFVLYGRAHLVRSPALYLVLAFMLVGLIATLPYVGLYGLDALRDAVLWLYGTLALSIALLLLRKGWVVQSARVYVRWIPVFLIWIPLAVLASQLFGSALPRLPGSDVPLIDLKGGDVAVHLAGVAAALLLGLPTALNVNLRVRRHEWMWWALWLAAAAIPLFRVRAGLLAVAAAVLLVLLFRPGSRWGKPLTVLSLAVFCFVAFSVQVKLGEGRNTISANSLLLNLQSIAGGSGDAYRDGTRAWRLHWWNDIENYTLRGPYFWIGKGYGVNLADADGYQVNADASLRSPHSVHFSVLARSGVPGLTLWILLQATFAFGLLRAYVRAVAAQQILWAKLNLWVLAYWAAFLINASFDVYLEGPVGGIWFWSVFGFGVALVEVQRRQTVSARRAAPVRTGVQGASWSGNRPSAAMSSRAPSSGALSSGALSSGALSSRAASPREAALAEKDAA